MKKVILARYGEIHLKGGNREIFLRQLKKNLDRRVRECGLNAKVNVNDSRVIVDDYAGVDECSLLDILTTTFGLVSVSVASLVPATPEAILESMKTFEVNNPSRVCTFKVEVNRADKAFPIQSNAFAAECGAVVLEQNPNAAVDVINPDVVIYVDIRRGGAFVYDMVYNGPGGLPVGVSGRCVVMLSGGIDSPVAAYLAAKRGLSVDFIHFATPPYTSELALEKVAKLRDIITKYTGRSRLYVVPFTEISEAIRKNCREEYIITLMRRFMVRIAESISIDKGIDCIITGENLAQVASQTIQGIASNNACSKILPILRPLITYDKGEIIDLAKGIGTYETSIQPHLDCCTVFVPARPVIKPGLAAAQVEENKLNVEILVKKAIQDITCI